MILFLYLKEISTSVFQDAFVSILGDGVIELARELNQLGQRGKSLGLTEDEIAFYDALADNGSTGDMIGDEKLRTIAQCLVDRVKPNFSIDLTIREKARAQIRAMVKRILREYGYPPNMEKAAAELFIEQAEVLCNECRAD